jgi:hypothetical protein
VCEEAEMKKYLTLMAGALLFVILISCNLSKLFQKEEEEKPYYPPSDNRSYHPPRSTHSDDNEGTAGLGVQLVTNLRSGVFRVKVNDELKAEHSFTNQAKSKNPLKLKKFMKAQDMEWGKEFKVPAGECKIKVVIEDNQGSRGDRVMNMNFKPNSHHAIRVVVRGAPGDMRVEIVQ